MANNLINKKIKGFTLVEVLVAISILLVVVTATLGTASDSLSTTIYAKEQVTAYFLAQEAIEDIKNLRHQNNLNNDLYWLCEGAAFSGLTTSQCGGEQFGLENTTDGGVNFYTCSTEPDCELSWDTTSNLYGGKATYPQTSPYTRIITLQQADDKALVTVEIKWKKSNRIGSLKIQETLYNWL